MQIIRYKKNLHSFPSVAALKEVYPEATESDIETVQHVFNSIEEAGMEVLLQEAAETKARMSESFMKQGK